MPFTYSHYSRSKRLLWGIRTSVVARVVMLLFFLLLIPSLLLPGNALLEHAIGIALVTFVIFGWISFFLVMPLRCDHCRRRMCIVWDESDYSIQFQKQLYSTPLREIVRSFYAPDELCLGTTQCCKCNSKFALSDQTASNHDPAHGRAE
jgi:predicted secreted protein